MEEWEVGLTVFVGQELGDGGVNEDVAGLQGRVLVKVDALIVKRGKFVVFWERSQNHVLVEFFGLGGSTEILFWWDCLCTFCVRFVWRVQTQGQLNIVPTVDHLRL